MLMPTTREHSDHLLTLITQALPMEAAEGSPPSLEWDENDQCSLTFDTHLAVIMTLNEVVEAMFLNWVLGTLPQDPEDQLEAITELMEANHEWNMTEGGTLGLDSNSGLVTLSYRVDLPLDDPGIIQNIIVKLYNICRHWQNTLTLSFPPDTPPPARRSVRDAL